VDPVILYAGIGVGAAVLLAATAVTVYLVRTRRPAGANQLATASSTNLVSSTANLRGKPNTIPMNAMRQRNSNNV
jgi:hypothetical protein